MKKPSPGKLISLRGREWMVLPSANPDILLVKPLGGSDDEITGIYLPLNAPTDQWAEASFPQVTTSDINDFETAKLLFDASRLSFRHASGPFRCMGKLSFRPRSYQIVPLVMALKLEVVRLLIADDVGIGKTIEALLILKEMLERGEIKRFAIVCQPHICDQWQKELKDKLDIDAVIIRSSTISKLERETPVTQSIFEFFPYQVISIDYIKADRKKTMLLQHCPEFVVVDEAHTCALPEGASSVAQQQRHHLIYDIAQKPSQHLLLLTATPHSGKDKEFQSLLNLLNPEFINYQFENLDQAKRRKIAAHFIQRKREHIRHCLKENTPFPDRDHKEVSYSLSANYLAFFKKAQRFARGLTQARPQEKIAKGRYWAALALLRGIMSSPAAGLEMLHGRIQRKMEQEGLSFDENPVIERIEDDSDTTHVALMQNVAFSNQEINELQELYQELLLLQDFKADKKAQQALAIIEGWRVQSKNVQPIIFCKYIATANYLGKIFSEKLPKSVEIQVITSELPDEQRKEMVQSMGAKPQRLLIATDCLSEGINLQDAFNAVLHYDLPWNPNRIEQREGRVDRFGQTSPQVKTWLLWGDDNPIDAIVLRVLINKVKDIRKATGVSIIVGEDNRSIMDAVLNEILLDPDKALNTGKQASLDFGDNYYNQVITDELEKAKQRATNLRDIFAHTNIKPEDIEADLSAVDEAIGDIQSVEKLVVNGIVHLGGEVRPEGKGYKALIRNLPLHLQEALPYKESVLISFESPTPEGFIYIGRNHRFTELLCQFLLALAFEEKGKYQKIARAAVIQTSNVTKKTTVIQFRVRNVVKEVKSKLENISEEMWLWGFAGDAEQPEAIDYATCKRLLFEAQSQNQLSVERQQEELHEQLSNFLQLEHQFKELAENRAQELVAAHTHFKNLVGGRSYEAVHPVLPPDVLGVYVFVPKVQFSFN